MSTLLPAILVALCWAGLGWVVADAPWTEDIGLSCLLLLLSVTLVGAVTLGACEFAESEWKQWVSDANRRRLESARANANAVAARCRELGPAQPEPVPVDAMEPPDVSVRSLVRRQ